MEEHKAKYIPGAYNGEKPYIFISYSHRDREQAMEIIGRFTSASYRVWFDQGITPGSEWDSNIAEHLEKCHVFLALISKAYLESGNCQDELNFARETNRKRVILYLEETELTGGIRMRIGQLPSLRKYEYEQSERFYEELFQTDGMGECLSLDDESCEEEDVPEQRETAGLERPLTSKTRRFRETLRHNRKHLLSAGLLLVILLASWFGLQKFQDYLLEKKENQIAVQFTPVEEMDEDTYELAKQVLAERIQILTGSDSTRIQERNHVLYVSLPKSLCEDIGIEWGYLEDYLYYCIAYSTNLYFVVPGTGSDYLPEDIYALPKDKIENIEVMNGSIAGIEVENEEGESESSYDYVEITLSDDYAKELKSEQQDMEGQLYLGFNLEESASSFYGCAAYPVSDDYTKIVLVDTDIEQENLRELLVYNLQSPDISGGFEVVYEIGMEWEMSDGSESLGENQQDYNDIRAPYVTLTYRYYGDLRSGELQDIKSALKKRLDALGQPYALAVYEDEEEDTTYFRVRIGTGHIGEAVMEAIACDSFSMGNSIDNLSETVRADNFSWEIDDEGIGHIVIQLDDSEIEDFRSATGQLEEQGGGTVYLKAGRARIAETVIDEEISDGKVVFDQLCLDGGECITQEDEWLLDFFETCLDTSLGSGMYLESAYFGSVDDRTYSEDGELGLVRDLSEEEELREAFSEICPGSETYFYGYGTQLRVRLHLPVDEALPSDAAEMAKEIYEACDFEAGKYESVSVYLIDRDNVAMERDGIFFDLSYLDGKPYVWGIFYNGRLEQYKEEFRELIESDPFYQDLTLTEEEYEGTFLSEWMWGDEE